MQPLAFAHIGPDGKRLRVTVPYRIDVDLDRGDPASDTAALRFDLVPGPVTVEAAPTLLGLAAPDVPALTALEQIAGRPADVWRVYHDGRDTGLAKPLLDAKAIAALAGGRRVLVSFAAPYTDVAGGKLDAALDRYAAEIAAAGEGRVDVAFGHEPDTYAAGQAPDAYAKATARVRARFAAAGVAPRLVFVCQAYSWRGGAVPVWYPGDAVDMVAADGYNWQGVRPGAAYSPPADVFGGALSAAARLGKPLVVGEANSGGPRRGEWLAALWTLLTGAGVEYGVVFAVLADGGTHDWRILAGTDAAGALAAIAAL